MYEEILVAGFGGQGVIFTGKLLSEAALADGKYVACSVSYGPEMRGGTANTSVIISDAPVGSLVVSQPTVAIVMNEPSMAKFEPKVRESGLLVVNRTLVGTESKRSDIRTMYVPATNLALDAGNKDVANVVLLGAMLEGMPVVSHKAVMAALAKMLTNGRSGLLPANVKALDLGGGFARDAKLAAR